jgi:hypothetical protein
MTRIPRLIEPIQASTARRKWLVEIFNGIRKSFRQFGEDRLVTTEATKVVIVKIMVETLGIFGMAMTHRAEESWEKVSPTNPDARDHR